MSDLLSTDQRSSLVGMRENFQFRARTAPLMSVVSMCAVVVLLWAVVAVLADQGSDAPMWVRVPLAVLFVGLAVVMAGFARAYWREVGDDRLVVAKIDAMLAARDEAEMLAACDLPIKCRP